MKNMMKSGVGLWMVAVVAFGADLQQAQVTTAAVTTNSAVTTLNASGQIRLLVLDVLTADAISVTVADQYTGATIYANTNVTADVTLVPLMVSHNSAGTAVATNTPAVFTGLKITTSAATVTTNTVTAKVLYDKNP